MKISFYINNSEQIYINKNIEFAVELEGNLRDASSITDPTFQISGYNESFINANYCYIPEFKRYYYVISIISVRTGLWEVKCHVDVLMSYKEQILRQSALIARQENRYNLYLDDDKFLVNAPRQVVAKNFPNRIPTGSGSFVLTIAGGQGSASE